MWSYSLPTRRPSAAPPSRALEACWPSEQEGSGVESTLVETLHYRAAACAHGLDSTEILLILLFSQLTADATMNELKTSTLVMKTNVYPEGPLVSLFMMLYVY